MLSFFVSTSRSATHSHDYLSGLAYRYEPCRRRSRLAVLRVCMFILLAVSCVGDELFSDAHAYEEIEDGFFIKAEGKVGVVRLQFYCCC